MKRILPAILIAAAGLGMLNAQTKVMTIEYKDGTKEIKKVTDVQRITFGDEAQVDPSDKMVDLGLSVKWASYNVGAVNPWEPGNFYAYGEIEPKTEYTLENYQWYYDNDGEEGYAQWEEYFRLGATITGTNYDVAHVKWGDQWRIPTQDEWRELINNCEFTWTGMQGMTGVLATSMINGNSIFLPAAGNMVDAEHTHDQLGCFYWTSTETAFDGSDYQECRNYRANLDAQTHSAEGYDYPEVGFSIRPVYGPVPEEEKPSYKVPTEMVDLGLSVKWAPFNIGATEPTSKGAYFSWGETRQKDYNHIYNYKWYDPITDSYVEIGDQISNTEYDAAADLWGDGWRLPTEEEMKELVEQCTWEVSGYCYKVTGPNGNSIYLPGAGFSTYKGKPKAVEQSGYYWTGNGDVRTNNQGKKMDSNATCLKFTRDTYKKTFLEPKMDFFSKAGGIQIRPVHE